jgi:hypothetical protein
LLDRRNADALLDADRGPDAVLSSQFENLGGSVEATFYTVPLT